jgi:hypothetical protein
MQTAGDCVEGECSLEEVGELIHVLKGTQSELSDRLDKVMNMIAHLQHINQKEERKTDEVRRFVSDMLRVFNTDVSAIFDVTQRTKYFSQSLTLFSLLRNP